jgi:hypothetical protein
MKYMIWWFERPQGAPMEYENAQNESSRCLASGRPQSISRSSFS